MRRTLTTEILAPEAASEVGALLRMLRTRQFLTAAAVLVAFDSVLILLHCAVVLAERGIIDLGSVASMRRLDISRDWSVAEYTEYAKAVAAAIALGVAFAASSRPVFLILAAFFAYLGIDNGFRLHEAAAGGSAEGAVAPGELVYFVLTGAALAALLMLAWPRVAARTRDAHRVHVAVMILAILAYGAFAVGVDAVHLFVAHHVAYTDAVLGLLEDGGELVMLSVAVILAVAIALRCLQLRRESGSASVTDSRREIVDV